MESLDQTVIRVRHRFGGGYGKHVIVGERFRFAASGGDGDESNPASGENDRFRPGAYNVIVLHNAVRGVDRNSQLT